MNLHKLLNESYQTFLQEAQTARIILLHPDSRFRSMLVAKLINESDYKVFYYAIGLDDVDLRSFIYSITNSLADQYPMFGRHTNMLSKEIFDEPYQHFDLILDTFVQDMAEISSDPFILVFDEFDLSDRSDDVQHFVERLSSRFPAHGKIVINSRTLPRLPWVSMIAQKRAVILKDTEVISHQFYGTTKTEKTDETLEVYALGPGFVMLNNQAVDSWEGHLPRLLFFFALDRPLVTRSEICQAFWPELDADQAVNVFHVTKRRLHKALDADVLIHEDGYYLVNPDLPVYYDVTEFVDSLMTGRSSNDPEVRMSAWKRAADLYRGPFLKGHDDSWIKDRREEFLSGYIEVLTEMAAVWHDRGRHEIALSLLQKGVEADPHNEILRQDVMNLYNHMGRRSEAAAHYQSWTAWLKEQNLKPSEMMRAFYDNLFAS